MRKTQSKSNRSSQAKAVLRGNAPKALKGEIEEIKAIELGELFAELDELNYSNRWETLAHLEVCFSEIAKTNQLFTTKSFQTLSRISQLFLTIGEHKQIIAEQRQFYENLTYKQEKKYRTEP